MSLPDVIQLGPFLVKMSMLIRVVSILLAFASVHLRLREERELKKTIWEIMSGGILLGFVVWKFSYILLYPSKAMEQPASILYFSGGDRGFWLAMIAVLVYLVVTVRKREIPIPVFAASLALGGWTAWAAAFLLTWAVEGQDGWYSVQQAAIGILFLLLVIRKWKTLTNAVHWLNLLMWFGISQVYVAFFSQEHSPVLAGLSREQWLSYLIAVLAWILVSRARDMGGASHEKK